MKMMGIERNGKASAMRIMWHENVHPYLKGEEPKTQRSSEEEPTCATRFKK
jgi:hypothetical protein